jgi:hypothetical protein
MDMGPFQFYRSGAIVGMRGYGAETEINDDTIAAVNRYTLRPLLKKDFVVFTMDLCNNRVDSHFSRFPEEELLKINAKVPGRPFMERHDTRGSLPRGTFFRSRMFRHGSDDYVSVRPDVYILAADENRSFIRNIEGGVYRSTSIGFSFMHPQCSVCGEDIRTCNHTPGRSYGDETCHYVMRDVVEVLEGSLVYWGSQSTNIVGQSRNAVLSLPEALEAAREEFHEPIELTSGRPARNRLSWPYGAEE